MIPIFLHPTRIIFLDDNIEYLKNLSLHLPYDLFLFKFYNDPQQALDNILTDFSPKTNTHWNIQNPNQLDSCLIEIDIPSLYKQCYDSKRFSALSTIVVDYEMPNMDGLEFLQQINIPGVQKILLTGEAGTDIAIEALNNNLIHQYIPKHSLDLESQLLNLLKKSQFNYFRNLSLSTIDALSCQQEPFALEEKEFEDFFQEIIKSHNVIEYFLLDPVGSFFMLTASEEIFILYTQNEDQAESYYLDIKDLPSMCFTNKEKDAIKNRKKILCFHSFNNHCFPDPTNWKRYFNKANTIKGNNTFYCSIKKIDPDLDSELKEINVPSFLKIF